jgi:HEAT repeat protein
MRAKLIITLIVVAALTGGGWFAYTRWHATPPEMNATTISDDDGAMTVAKLSDKRAEVRRKALEALGASRDLCLDEELLPLLHDAEKDSRERCESFLKARGLTDKEIQIGRIASDPLPLKRLQLIDKLPTDFDLDAEAWLQRLSQDPSPAVRIGAARAAMDPSSTLGVNLTDRVREMAQKDPDGTVRQIADYLIRDRGQ